LFELRNTYEILLEFGNITRPVCIKILRCIENQKLYRARIWDRCIYDSDELNREITTIVIADYSLITGKKYPSEAMNGCSLSQAAISAQVSLLVA